jgi:hypothetical protein
METTACCTKCKNIKQLSDFPPRKDKVNKVDSWCRDCRKNYVKNRSKECKLYAHGELMTKGFALKKSFKSKEIKDIGVDLYDAKKYSNCISADYYDAQEIIDSGIFQ